MIVVDANGHLRLITQNDHAHFAAELLSLWVTDGLPEHPRRRELLVAARQHDNGWRETDSAPWCDLELGRPHDFRSLPDGERREIWQRGIERLVEREPWAALLVVRHALALHRDRCHEPSWGEAFTVWRDHAARLLEETGGSESEVEVDYRWIALSDLLSLVACGGVEGEVESHGFRAGLRRDRLILDPFPMAGTTAIRIACRRIPDRTYTSDSDLAVELAAARWQEHVVRVAAG